MGAKKKGATAPRPRSGFATEEQRGTERLTLRLDPEAMDLLRGYAKDLKWPIARVVSMALESFKNDPMTQTLMAEAKRGGAKR